MSSDGSHAANSHAAFVPAIKGRDWRQPLEFKAVILDLDGTMMPTYKMFIAVDHLLEWIKKQADDKAQAGVAEGFLAHLREKPIQQILHRPHKTLEAVLEFAEAMQISVPTHVIRAAQEIQSTSFHLYPGVNDFLDVTHKAGTPVSIYTNSPDFHTAMRLTEANVKADKLNAIWTKINEKFEPLSWQTKEDSPLLQRIAEIMIPYSFKKPNATPLERTAELTGVHPGQILVVGEGNGDLMSVYQNRHKPAGVFAFQEHGAREICERQQRMNQQLRPGSEELGYRAVRRQIDQLGVEREVIPLHAGFISLLNLEAQGYIRFSVPDVMPEVQNRRLVAPQEADRRNLQASGRLATAGVTN